MHACARTAAGCLLKPGVKHKKRLVSRCVLCIAHSAMIFWPSSTVHPVHAPPGQTFPRHASTQKCQPSSLAHHSYYSVLPHPASTPTSTPISTPHPPPASPPAHPTPASIPHPHQLQHTASLSRFDLFSIFICGQTHFNVSIKVVIYQHQHIHQPTLYMCRWRCQIFP